MTKTLGRGPTRSERVLAVIAVVALVTSLMTLYMPLPARANTENPNHPDYWEARYPGAVECYKYGATGSNSHGSSNGSYVTLNQFEDSWPGDHWELLVVKGGSEGEDGGGNAVYEHPEAGDKYYPPKNAGGQTAGVSHWIVCTGEHPDEEPDEASVDVDGVCVEDEFVVSITTENATVSIDLDGDGVFGAGEAGLTTDDYVVTADDENFIDWEATADGDAEFDEEEATSGQIWVAECEEDFLASVDVDGECVDETFHVTISTEHAAVNVDLNGDDDFDDEGESDLTGGTHDVSAEAGDKVAWHAIADEDAEFDEDVDETSGELTVEDCEEEEEPEEASAAVEGACADDFLFKVTVSADNAMVSVDLNGDGDFDDAGESGLTSGVHKVTASPGTDIAWEATADEGAEFDEQEETSGEIEVISCAQVMASIVVTVTGTCVLQGESGQGVITVTIPVDGAATVVISDGDGAELATLTESGTVNVPEGATYEWEAEPSDGFEFPPGSEAAGEIDIVECSEPEVRASVLVTVSGVCIPDGDEGIGRITVNMSVDGAATVVVSDSDGDVVGTRSTSGTITVAEGETYIWNAGANDGFEFPEDFDAEGDVTIPTCSEPEVLPFTGVNSGIAAGVAALMMVAGALLLFASRRLELS